MPTKTPVKHWRMPGQGKNIGDVWRRIYVPATYCGRRIITDWAKRDRWSTSTLAEHTTEMPDQVTCKTCLKLGRRHQDADRKADAAP